MEQKTCLFFQAEQGVGAWRVSVSAITRHKNIIKQTEEVLTPFLRAPSFDEDVTLKVSNDCVSYKSSVLPAVSLRSDVNSSSLTGAFH